MGRRLLAVLVAATVLQLVAFRYLHRDLLWLDTPASAQSEAATTRASATSALDRPQLSRRHLEALIRATNRDDLRDLQVLALDRLARQHPDDPAVLLRLAEALRLAGQFDAAARTFAAVADAP